MPNNPTGFFNNEYPYTDFHELNLSWIIEKVKNLLDRVSSIEGWEEEHKEQYDQLKDLYDQLEAGQFPPALYNQLRLWFNENAFDLVGEMIKHVYFGLTDDGYFTVYIPENWREVEFRTSEYDYFTPLMTEYGHLLLLY